jgi:WhiB family transcriptional regulator, redox-sensing transcriptional regulator
MHQAMVKMLMDPSSSFPDLAELLRKPVWMESAACKGMSTDTFISSRTRPLYTAKAVCSECPVRVECLGYAMDDDSCVGVWGGTSTVERRSMRHDTRPGARRPGASTG